MKRLNSKIDKTTLKDVSELYLSAFPENERPPLHWFLKCLEHESNNVYAYYEDDEFVGFCETVQYSNIVYISYLTVSPLKRNQGYGSKILSDIKKLYENSTILLCFEEVDTKYPDYENRKKRQEFYRRNGFIDYPLKTQEGEVIYQSAVIGDAVITFKIYQKIFDCCYGEGASDKYLKEYLG